MHYILTGEIDSGKSTYLLELARRLIDSGRNVSGWITPAHMEGGEKAGHDLILMEGGQFAEPIPFTRRSPFDGSLQWRRYHFNRLAFERAKELADRLFRVTSHESRVTDLFIMDEIGPLELEEGGGFIATVRHALADATTTLSVVRNGLEEKLAGMIGAQATVFPFAQKEGLMEALDLRP